MNFLKEMERDYVDLVGLGAQKILIGRTTLNYPIYAFRVGSGSPQIIAQYAIHAREYITYYLAIKHIKRMLKSPIKGTIYFIPVVNIDGICLVQNGVNFIEDEKYLKNIQKIQKNQDFSLWKANICGVDLNTNFPARWGSGRQNITYPNYQNYIGEYPASEVETRALMEFTLKIKPDLTLSFHSKGEVIYYDFHQKLKQKKNDKKIAKIIAKSTGYKIARSGKSAGGYKDWCIDYLKITAMTIEVGDNNLNHPIMKTDLPHIWATTKNLYADLLYFLNKH